MKPRASQWIPTVLSVAALIVALLAFANSTPGLLAAPKGINNGIAKAGAAITCQNKPIVRNWFNNVNGQAPTLTIMDPTSQPKCIIDFGFDLRSSYIVVTGQSERHYYCVTDCYWEDTFWGGTFETIKGNPNAIRVAGWISSKDSGFGKLHILIY